MVFFTSNLTSDLTGFIIALIVIIISYYKYKFAYWKRKGLHTLRPTIPFGNAYKVFSRQKSLSDVWTDLYIELKELDLKHGGGYFMTKPVYIPRDLDVIKAILISDFQYFQGHGLYVNEENDPLTGQLFNLNGEKWRKLRMKLTPTFTSGKIKIMFETMAASSANLHDFLLQHCDKGETDIKDILQRFTAQIIESCAFGIDSNCIKDGDSELISQCKLFFDIDLMGYIKNMLQFVLPTKLLNQIKFKTVNPHLTDFFINEIRSIIEHRERNNVYRKDFLHLLLQLKNRGDINDDQRVTDADGISKEIGLNFNQLCAQAFAFYLAGFETSSTAMTFTIYELTKNQEVKNKVTSEIINTLKKYDNKLSYEAIHDMTYLNNVLKESLRMHPPIPSLIRVCEKDYNVPGTEVIIEKGTLVSIPTMAIHMDEKVYSNPETFNPDRFKSELSHPCAWLPFGDGPRSCLGLRFGILQAKIGLITILRDFDFSLGNKTIDPLEYTANHIVLENIGGIWINLKKLNS